MTKKSMRSADRQITKIDIKETEQINDLAGTSHASEFTTRSVMVLRQAVIDLYQKTNTTPDAVLHGQLQKIKDKHDRLDRIKARASALKADALAGRYVDLSDNWD